MILSRKGTFILNEKDKEKQSIFIAFVVIAHKNVAFQAETNSII